MAKLNELPKIDVVTQLIYGAAGNGKSDYLGSTGDRTLLLDCENRRGVWGKDEFKKRRGNWNPFYEVFTEEPTPEGGAKALDEITKCINRYFNDHYNDFDVICLDGATSFRRFAWNKGLDMSGSINSKSSKREGKIALQSTLSLVQTDVRDLTNEMQLVSKFLYMILETCKVEKKHFIMTAHERIDFKDKTKADMMKQAVVHSIKPAFTGQTFPDELPGLFDLVWHFETEGIGDKLHYYARTAGDAHGETEGKGTMAKSSIGSDWPIKLYKPDFKLVLEKVKTS